MRKLPKNIIYSIVFGIFTLRMVMKILGSRYSFLWQVWIPIVNFFLGAVFGNVLYFIDRVVDIYWGNSESKLATVVKEFFGKGKYCEGIKILKQNKKLQRKLVFRSAVFQTIWVFLMIFSITSTQVMFGRAAVFGVGLRLFLDEWEDFLNNKEELSQWLFWQLNIEINKKDLKKYMIGVSFLMAIIFLLMLRG